ncbi:shikimate dehydrogenase [Gorillibacterium timonense]|uniref:shikimate dehydrogenase n=1 Tax=Gorillibacterium timonense TaxID=1689269 RepID=UPI00071D7174|nr:shikimate dehydrogenase [Gorillibacterium timonense]
MTKEPRPIDSRSVLYGVFGDPVAHSQSPRMLNRAFAETGLAAVYTAFHVTPAQLPDAVKGIRALGIRGVNVTIPHKVDVMEHLDAVDESARLIGAVNTIVNDGGRLTGYNTDGIGYVRSLKEETGFDPAGKRVVVLGAGGAARGIVWALHREGTAEIIIVNRTAERAVELAAAFPDPARLKGTGLEGAEEALCEADLVVNTTRAGMHPYVGESPLPPELLNPRLLVSDIVYNPRKTLFLAEAEKKGCAIHGGLGMFIHQGAYAFELWTGQPAPVDAMREEVESALAAKTDVISKE